MKLLTQSLTIGLAFILLLLITSTPLSGYMIPILGLVIIFSVIFLIIRQRSKKEEELFIGSNKEIFTIIVAIILAIFLTGGLNSGLFFLLYFLVFGIVFIFKPETVFVLLLGTILVFAQYLSQGDLFSNLIKLGSLVFLSPISYFFGKEFEKKERLETEIKDKTGQILEDAQTLRGSIQDEEEIDEIEDIIKKSNELRKETED